MEGITDTTSAFGTLSPEERRRLGRLGGMLMLLASVFAFPAVLFIEPAPEPYEHLIGLFGIVAGLAVLFAPWERLSSNWLHAVPILGAIQVSLGVAVFSDDYGFYYVLLATYVAYVTRELNVLVAYVCLFTILLLLPLSYGDGAFKEQMHHVLITFPVLVTTVAMVRYLRDTLERREAQYREFAHEAVGVAMRLRGDRAGTPLDDRLEEIAGVAAPANDGEPDPAADGVPEVTPRPGRVARRAGA